MVPLTQRGALPTNRRPDWWWSCLLTAALFAFHVHYVRIHLLTELHHFDRLTANAQTAGHHDDHPGHGEHGHDQHLPHSVTEHQLHLAGKQQISFVPIHFLLSETRVSLTLPEPREVCSLWENGGRPGESPPDPAQPRAPPPV